jgi:hypothetical protein
VLHVDRARIPRLLAAAGPQAVPDLDPDTAAGITAAAEHGTTPSGGEPARPGHAADAPASGPAAATAPIPATTPAGDGDPLAALLACLRAAGPRGAKVAELAAAIGRAKTWVYERLQDLHRTGQVERAGHGRWRLTHPDDFASDQGDDDHGDPEDGHDG